METAVVPLPRLKRLVRWLPRLAFAAALAAGLAGAWRWSEAARINRLIAAASPELGRVDSPYADLARGLALAREGHLLEAAAAYRHAGEGGAHGIAVAAWYDIGNLYLKEARRLSERADTEDGAAEHARALAELAKDGYRRALRLRPDYWPARYNLERTLAAYPDPEDLDSAPLPTHGRERAVTTMRGVFEGLP